MALNQIQQVALELLKHKDITVKEAYVLASEFLSETDYLDEAQPIEVEVKFQAAMSDFEQWTVRLDCEELDIQTQVNARAPKRDALDAAKLRMKAAINDKLAQSGKKAGEIIYTDRDYIRQWINYPK